MQSKFASGVWNKIFQWFGVITVLLGDTFTILESFQGQLRNGKGLKGLLLEWHKTICAIWSARNSFTFYSNELWSEMLLRVLNVFNGKPSWLSVLGILYVLSMVP